ncbi:MAG: hypothetical protein UR52_C0021G0005 [Candidatus Gottesmanbacteria bacterium GW2011_GWA1_34_13]|uniref:DUF192 domain-containing protein n=1 Tax=Candidatus Gottesmanbacteria bacterium GW2011_GWA1_34_13 TaxID=1618434 RepID=A0A0G0AN60_9BACT|nr:MAG: hypothetical protein UR52_C0021G0005 [Candidatus Gottesmanbacteria bacterium GW2011_GWA1_34_13]
MFKKIFILLLFIIGGVLVYFYYTKNGLPFISKEPKPTSSMVSQIKINNQLFEIDIADTNDKRAQGLSGKSRLCENCGMLFIFDTKDDYGFWMKDMLFPLDFVWIDVNIIVDITENVPVPITATYLPQYRPKQPVNRVLELNTGIIKKYQIKIGDSVEYLFL